MTNNFYLVHNITKEWDWVASFITFPSVIKDLGCEGNYYVHKFMCMNTKKEFFLPPPNEWNGNSIFTKF